MLNKATSYLKRTNLGFVTVLYRRASVSNKPKKKKKKKKNEL